MNREKVVTYFNNAAARIWGVLKKKCWARRLFDAFPEAKGSIFEKKYTEALRWWVTVHDALNGRVKAELP